MIYLIDANVLITANNTYYPLDTVPEFWDWIIHQAANGKIKMPREIIDEVLAGRRNDPLYDWINDKTTQETLLLDEESVAASVNFVVESGYANDLTDNEIEGIGQDPFLIAYALNNPNRCIITAEVSASRKTRQNRRIPDVCRTLSIDCEDQFHLNRVLGFSTSWSP